MTPDIIAFLRSCLDDDERVARSASPAPWAPELGACIRHSGPSTSQHPDGQRLGRMVAASVGAYDLSLPRWADIEHIVHWDPGRAVAEVGVKRRILAEHPEDEDGFCGDGVGLVGCKWAYPCPTVRLLAVLYADCPGFRDEWKIH